MGRRPSKVGKKPPDEEHKWRVGRCWASNAGRAACADVHVFILILLCWCLSFTTACPTQSSTLQRADGVFVNTSISPVYLAPYHQEGAAGDLPRRDLHRRDLNEEKSQQYKQLQQQRHVPPQIVHLLPRAASHSEQSGVDALSGDNDHRENGHHGLPSSETAASKRSPADHVLPRPVELHQIQDREHHSGNASGHDGKYAKSGERMKKEEAMKKQSHREKNPGWGKSLDWEDSHSRNPPSNQMHGRLKHSRPAHVYLEHHSEPHMQGHRPKDHHGTLHSSPHSGHPPSPAKQKSASKGDTYSKDRREDHPRHSASHRQKPQFPGQHHPDKQHKSGNHDSHGRPGSQHLPPDKHHTTHHKFSHKAYHKPLDHPTQHRHVPPHHSKKPVHHHHPTHHHNKPIHHHQEAIHHHKMPHHYKPAPHHESTSHRISHATDYDTTTQRALATVVSTMSSTTGHLLTTTSQTFTSSASAQIGASVPTRTPVSQAPAANTTKKGDWDLSASKIANELSTLLSDLTYTVTEPVVTSSNPNVSNIATAASNSASNVYVQGGVPVPSASGGSDKADAASALPASTNRTPSDGTASGQAAQHRPSLTSSKGSPAAGQLSQPMPAPTLPNPVLSDHGKVVSAPSVANDQPNTREATAGGGPQTIAGQGGSSAGDKSSSSTVIFNGSSGSGGGFSPTGYKLGDVPPKEESANTGSAITGGGVGGSGDGNSSSMPTKGQGSSSNDAKPNTSPSNVSTQDGLIIPQIERPKASTTQGEHAGGTNRDGDINGSITKSQTEAGGGKGSSGSTAQGGQADGSRKNGSAQQGNNLAPNTSDTAASLPIPTKDQESSLNHAKPKTSPSNMSTQDGLILPQTERPKASTPQGENAGGTSRESADNVSITKTQTEAGAGKGSSGRTAQTGHADESAKNGSAQQGNNLAPNTSDTAVHPPNMSTPDGLILPEIGNPNDVATTRTKAGATSGKSSIGKGQDDAKNGVEGSGSTPGNGNIDQAGQGRSAQQEIDLAPLLPDSAIGQQASSSTGAAEDDVVKESASPDDAAGLVTDEPGADDSEDGAVETEIVDEEGATEEGALDSKPSASTSDASRLGAVELRPDASQTPDKADASVQLSPTADEPELLGDDPNLDQPLAEVDLQPVEPEVNDTGVIAEPEEEPEEIDLADPETAPAVPDIEDTAPTADVTEPSADSDATLSAGLESASDTTPPEAELQNTSEVDLLSGDEAATADSDAAVDGPELEGADADAAAEGGVEDGAGDSSELPAEVTEPPESPDASGGDDEVAASPLEEDESSESPDSVNETPAAPPPASVPLLFVPGGYTHDDAVTICSLAAVTSDNEAAAFALTGGAGAWIGSWNGDDYSGSCIALEALGSLGIPAGGCEGPYGILCEAVSPLVPNSVAAAPEPDTAVEEAQSDSVPAEEIEIDAATDTELEPAGVVEPTEPGAAEAPDEPAPEEAEEVESDDEQAAPDEADDEPPDEEEPSDEAEEAEESDD